MSFNESAFRSKVQSALNVVTRVLETTKHPTHAENVQHEYTDKYLLSGYLADSAIAASLNVLQQLGVTEDIRSKLSAWAADRSVSFRLHSEERCVFDRKEEREVEIGGRHEREYSSGFKITDKTIETITEWFWKFDVEWELFCFQGNDPDTKIVLQGRKGAVELVTRSDVTPRPQVSVVPDMDLNATWLLQQIGKDGKVRTVIDREKKSCRTPRRNDEVDAALGYFHAFGAWLQSADEYFRQRLFPIEPSHGLKLGAINESGLFVPVLPLFERRSGKTDDAEDLPNQLATLGTQSGPESPVMPLGDLYKFLAEQRRSTAEKFSALARDFQPGNKLITIAEAKFCVLALHGQSISRAYQDGVDYIEDMLRKQLIAALGKVLTPVDFANYMKYHNRRLFRKEFQPTAFAYHIRRPDHYPVGVLSIEQQLDTGELADPIETIVKHSVANTPMRFPINASTHVSFLGHRYVHAFVDHQFSGQSGSTLRLSARARQFSSFILMVGRIAGKDLFHPSAAIIVKDKDDLMIPLLMETIPTPKEFKDAIESLSPEQQRFAKAYRGMQLASTLFGIAVIQIKPQMEKLLNLKPDGLTKEIDLTQRLMDMFIKYQIPSDLLSFDEKSNPGASDGARIQGVEQNVQAIEEMLEDSKKREIEERRLQEEKRRLEAERLAAEAARQREEEMLQEMLLEDRSYQYESKSMEESLSVKSAPRRRNKSKGASVVSKLSRALSPRKRMASASIGSSSASSSGAVSTGSRMMESASVAPSAAPQPVSTPAAPSAKPAPSEPPAETPPEKEIVEKAPKLEGDADDDVTKIPGILDAKFEKLDEDSSLRPTIINPGKVWTERVQKRLLGNVSTVTLRNDEQKAARNSAFDLLDALSRSGSLTIDYADMHVVLAATHCFDKNLLNTLVQDNMNPIEKLERSNLIVATTIQGKTPQQLVKAGQLARVQEFQPILFLDQ